MQRDDGIISYCVWSAGIVSLLPRTDWVMFFRPNGDNEPLGHGDWDRVIAVVGDLMTEVEDLYPVRFRVSDFPSAEQLEQIGLE